MNTRPVAGIEPANIGVTASSVQSLVQDHASSFPSNQRLTQLQSLRLVQPFQFGDRLYTSESDVCRRQILTCKESYVAAVPHLKEIRYL